MDTVVIVGGGLGGTNTAKTLRSCGFEGTITLLAKESHHPYDRPPLSKDVLLGTIDMPKLAFDADRLGIELYTETEATELARVGSRWAVRCADDREFAADRVVAATGALPLTLPVIAAHPHGRSLRTLDDALALRSLLRPRMDLVVVGAGWIGGEVASAATSIGCAVHVIDLEPAPLSRAFGTEVGNLFAPWYREANVDLRLGRTATTAGDGHIELDDGAVICADVVVNGVGVAPNTAWLAASSVELDERGAVVVDEFLASVSSPGVYAIGDCASYPSTRYSTRMRPEHWANAQQSATAVAATIAGAPTPHDPVPFFWSSQFGHLLHYVGHHSRGDRLRFRGNPPESPWSAYWLDTDDKPTAFLTVDRPRDAGDARRLLAADAVFDLVALADDAVPVRRAVRP